MTLAVAHDTQCKLHQSVGTMNWKKWLRDSALKLMEHEDLREEQREQPESGWRFPQWLRVKVHKLRRHLLRRRSADNTYQPGNCEVGNWRVTPGPPLPIKTYTTLVPTFAKKGQFFKRRREFAKSRKRSHFLGISRRSVEKGVNILHVSACFHPDFHTLDLGRVFRYSFQIRRIEKYYVHGKNVWYSFTNRGTLSYIMKKNAFYPKKGLFLLDLKISDFGWKRGLFVVQNPRKGCVRAWYTWGGGGYFWALRFTVITGVYRSFVRNITIFTQYCLTRCISKLTESFDIH